MASGIDIAQLLASRRLTIYGGGLAVIVAVRMGPSVGRWELPAALETALVGLILAIMVGTYLAERVTRVSPPDSVKQNRPAYTSTERTGIAITLGGFVIGLYFLLTDRPLVAGPFLVGAVLLVRWVFATDPTLDHE